MTRKKKEEGFRIINAGTERVDVRTLVAHPKNPNIGNVDAIRESIRKNGFFGFIGVQRGTNYVLWGRHRWTAAVEEGATELDVVWLDVDDKQAIKIMLADNRTAELASRDPDLLAEVLAELKTSEEGLEGSGYDDEFLELLLKELEEGEEDDDGDDGEADSGGGRLCTCPNCGHEFDPRDER